VHITYQSAFVDDAGKLQLRRDVYGVDNRTIAAIKTERAIIEVIPESKKEPEVASTPGTRKVVAAPRAMSFFQSLFYGGRPAAPPRPSRSVYR